MPLLRPDALALMHEYHHLPTRCESTMYAGRARHCAAMAERAGKTSRHGGWWGCCTTSTTSATPTRRTSASRSIRRRACASSYEVLACRRRAATRHPGARELHRRARATRPWRGRSSRSTELCGFFGGLRPRPSVPQPAGPGSVERQKKLKDKAFARGVSREDVLQGARPSWVCARGPTSRSPWARSGPTSASSDWARRDRLSGAPAVPVSAKQTVANAINRSRRGGRPIPGQPSPAPDRRTGGLRGDARSHPPGAGPLDPLQRTTSFRADAAGRTLRGDVWRRRRVATG